MRLLISRSLIVILFFGCLISLRGEDRTWKNTDGKTVQGSISGLTGDSVEIISGGKRLIIPVSTLSKADQDYVAKKRSSWPLKLDVKTVRLKSNSTGTQKDKRQIQVDLKGGVGRTLNVQVVWLGDGGNSAKYGRYKLKTRKVAKDGFEMFKITYERKGKYSRNYRGYAVRVTNEAGETLAEEASQVPFLRFLPQK